MRIYKNGGVSGNPDDIKPLNPHPAKQIPTERPQFREKSLMERLVPVMEARMNLNRQPSRLDAPSRDEIIQYLAKKEGISQEEATRKLPEEVKAYLIPTRPGMGGGYSDSTSNEDAFKFVGMSNEMPRGLFGRQERKRAERGSLFPRKYINLSPLGVNMPLTQTEERLHSMQTELPMTDQTGYDKIIRNMRRGYEAAGIDASGPDWDYYFDPSEMEAKVMGAKLAMQKAGVIGEGPLTDEDLDNMYLFIQDQSQGSDIENYDMTDMRRIFGRPDVPLMDNPEYRNALLDLVNMY
jgi:hypothetical protein